MKRKLLSSFIAVTILCSSIMLHGVSVNAQNIVFQDNPNQSNISAQGRILSENQYICDKNDATLMSTQSTSVMGWLDEVTPNTISGWACDTSNPSTSICVHIYFREPDTDVIIRGVEVLADEFRSDLQDIFGFGCGYHGFTYDWSDPIQWPSGKYKIEIYGIDEVVNPLLSGCPHIYESAGLSSEPSKSVRLEDQKIYLFVTGQGLTIMDATYEIEEKYYYRDDQIIYNDRTLFLGILNSRGTYDDSFSIYVSNIVHRGNKGFVMADRTHWRNPKDWVSVYEGSYGIVSYNASNDITSTFYFNISGGEGNMNPSHNEISLSL